MTFVQPGGIGQLRPASGLMWTTVSGVPNMGALIFDGTAFIGCGGSGIYRSTDGITWSTLSSTVTPTSIAYSPSIPLYVAVRDNNSSGTGAWSSPDATTWTARTIGAGFWVAVVASASLFVTVANNPTGGGGVGATAYSTNGTTWTTLNTPQDNRRAVAANNSANGFLWVGGTAAGGYSLNGGTWTAMSLPGIAYNSVAFGNGVFCAVGASIGFVTSNFTTVTATTPPSLGNSFITFNPDKGVFATTSWGIFATSPDGINWTSDVAPNWSPTGFAYGNGRYVILSSTNAAVALA